jgi:Protein of unknown function (DUF2764)
MSNQYYFVGTSLPSLSIGEKPEICWESLQYLLQDNLLQGDLDQIGVLRRYFDILNVRAFLKSEKLDDFGNLERNAIEEALLGVPGYFPPYAMQFFEQHESRGDRLYYFPELIHAFYREEVQTSHGFLKEYLEFERKLRLVLTAYRAKQLGRDLTKELQFEDPDDEFIVQLLVQKDAKSFEMPEGFEDLKSVLEEKYSSPLELHKALNEYRFNKLDELTELEVFSFDRILAYTARFFLAKKWMAMDKEQGLKIVDNIIKGKT